MKEFVKKHAKNRIISSLEGGYDLPSLTESSWAHINILGTMTYNL
jgi:acetoin utilization deacetylase AcuC-like enzyme